MTAERGTAFNRKLPLCWISPKYHLCASWWLSTSVAIKTGWQNKLFEKPFKMRFLRLKILILINLICFGVFGQHFDFVKITPGQGIVFNKDIIILGKTSIKEVCRILKIKDDPTAISIVEWTGFDGKTGRPSFGSDYLKSLIYKSLVFNFVGENESSFEL